MTDTCNLNKRRCQPCEGGIPPLSASTVADLLTKLDGWQLIENKISKTFSFRNFYQTMNFVNAVAWIANREDHHPDMAVSYNSCQVTYSTHAINGLSENDFICAAKIDLLLAI
ncbi:MAG: 4a-hydroxytetrahydrobiopterin dehydratase [Nitrosomonas sp.]|nr:4a-hydroxytetrahydrobiopterin dehydratase [Nitrosomonas sp.]